MLNVQNNFRGGLDLDTDVFQMRPDSYVDALNITIDAIEGNRDLAATNIIGNRLVNYTLPSGTNQVIGAYGDLIRNRVIYFIWNSNGNHVIAKYSNATRVISKVLENLTDTGNVDILEFTRFAKIIHVEVVHRDEGDLLYWVSSNTQPKGLIITKVEDGDYGVVDLDFITAAKSPPLQPAVVVYGNDTARSTNGLRKKLYQLRYRWKYDDFSRSTWSPWSDTPLPVGLIGTDNDSDPTKNNYIATTITTGKKNVTDIEIGVRELLNNTWSDMFLDISLNKEQLGISDDATYQYNYYNDNIPTVLDLRESLLLFDYFPLLAKSMVLANGNVLVYGAITEGYDNLGQDILDVEMSVDHIKNTGVEIGAPSLTYFQSGFVWTFYVTGSVPDGTFYSITGIKADFSTFLATYTSVHGDTTSDVAMGLFTSGNLNSPGYVGTVVGNAIQISPPDLPFSIINVTTIAGSGSSTLATATGWPWYSRYRFGLVYFDSKGRTNGVQTYVNQPATNGDFEVETGSFQLDGDIPKTPVINAEINHLPPSWAVKYCWVRSDNRTFDRQLYYVTCDFQSDADYYYFGFGNIQYYYDNNNKFIYTSIDSVVNPERGDRIKIVASANNLGYTGTIWANQDYEILGVSERVETGGSEKRKYVKVKKPITPPSPVFSNSVQMLSLIYTPITNNASQDKTVYWEFSQFYDIVDGFHMGQLQDQTALLPATFQFVNGDMYYRSRNMFINLVPTQRSTNLLLFDVNYSDFYPSAINGNGRAEVVEVNAKQTYYPATVRFGQEFQQNTTINGLNRFYYENLKDYNRNYGSILKMKIRDQYLRLGQELKIGVVPVNLQIIKTLTGDGQLTASDELLNTVNYYSGEWGVGDCPEAWASFNFADYFIDNRRGAILRLSQDGITPISVLYKVNSWGSVELPLRNGTTNFCYGAFDQRLNNYILAVEATDDSAAQTLLFDEENNIFESFVSYKPEMMTTLGTLLISFKSGALWTHDSTRYNSFYGVDYESNISPVFSKPGLEKKGWQSIIQVADGTWDCPSIKTNVNSFGTTPQETNLVAAEFTLYEGNPTASIKRDSNSRGGKINGSFMKGNNVIVKLRKQNAQNLVFLNMVAVRYVDSPLTPAT